MLIEFVKCFALLCYCLLLVDLEELAEIENCHVMKFQRNPQKPILKAS